MQIKAIAFAAAALVSLGAQADTVAQWSFNAGTTNPAINVNAASFSALGVSTSFVSQAGSSDLNAGQALNTTNYPAQGTGDLTEGVQFMIDTTGYDSLVFSFDQRNSGTASAWTALRYTLDGSSWTTATNLQMTVNSVFVNGISFDFSGIAGAADNASFGLQLLTTFAPGTSSYVGTGGSYGTGGTIRYDMVTLSGSVIPAVPEPESYALMLAGLGAIGALARRRKA